MAGRSRWRGTAENETDGRMRSALPPASSSLDGAPQKVDFFPPIRFVDIGVRVPLSTMRAFDHIIDNGSEPGSKAIRAKSEFTKDFGTAACQVRQSTARRWRRERLPRFLLFLLSSRSGSVDPLVTPLVPGPCFAKVNSQLNPTRLLRVLRRLEL